MFNFTTAATIRQLLEVLFPPIYTRTHMPLMQPTKMLQLLHYSLITGKFCLILMHIENHNL